MLKLVSKKKPDSIDIDLIDEDLDFLKGIYPEGGPAIQPEDLEPGLYPEPEKPEEEDTTLSDMEAEVEAKLAEELEPAPEPAISTFVKAVTPQEMKPLPEKPTEYELVPVKEAARKAADEFKEKFPEEAAKVQDEDIYDFYLKSGIDAYNKWVSGERKQREAALKTKPLKLRSEEISAVPERTPVQQILEQIIPGKADKLEQSAKAQNVVAIAKRLNVPIGEVRENYNEALAAVMKRSGPTTMELVMLGLAPSIVFSMTANALKTVLGLAKFAGALEVINLGTSMIQGEDYQFLAGKGAADLLPEETSQLAKETVEIAEFVAVGLAAIGATKAAPKLVERVTKDIFTEFKAPKRIVIPARKVASIFRTGEEISPEELDVIKSLGLSGSEYRAAVKQGLDIKIPAEKITTLVDKPYWVKLKSIFGRAPAERITRVKKAGERTVGRAPAGELPAEKPAEAPEVKIEIKPTPEKPPGAAEGKKAEKKVEALPKAKAPEEPAPQPAKEAKEEPVSALAAEEARKAEEKAPLTEAEKKLAKALEEEARLEAEEELKEELTAEKRAVVTAHVEEQKSYKDVVDLYPGDTEVEEFARERGREKFGKKAKPKKEAKKVPIDLPPKEYKAGKKGKAYLPDNTPVEFEYSIVELGELTASHTVDLAANKAYPEELQPRDKTRKAIRLQVEEIAKNPVAEKLMESPSVSIGAPMVGRDLLVESGNSRVIGLEKAYQLKGKPIEVYKSTIQKAAEKFGLNPEEIAKMKRPVLVRVRTTEVEDRVEFARKANLPEVATMSPVETAKNDATRMTDKDLSLFAPSQEGNIGAASNRTFITKFVEGLGAEEAAGMLTSEGGYTKKLIDRIQAAIFYRAYQDENLLTLMAEEVDPNIRNILNALTVAAGEYSKARIIVKDATTADNIISHIVGATKIIRQAREEKKTVDLLLDQMNLFERIPEEAKIIVQFLDENKRSGVRMGEFFKELALQVQRQLAKSNNLDLFGTLKISPLEIIESALEKVRSEHEKPTEEAPGLFGAEPTDAEVRPKGEPAEGKGAEVGAEGVEKERWEMTKEEYLEDSKMYIDAMQGGRLGITKENATRIFAKQHEDTVKKALAEGKPVPAEVLKDYPDLVKRKPTAPSGLADTGGYADIGGYEAPPGEGPGPSAMDLPEIVELARQLMQGKMPKIIKRLRAMHGLAAGIFRPYGKGAIELKASLFKDPLEGAKVLAHEIGHLIDWLPEKTMSRGNILGRIASLRKYMKHFLENRPGSAGPLTDADRARLRKEARKLVKEKSGELIDEEIRKEMPITPDDVLAIWRDATTDITREKNPELYEYITKLSNAEKASIVKEAMKGIVPRRLKQFAKVVMEKTGRKIKAKPSKKDIHDKYRELVRKEIEKRRLFQMDTIMNELIDLTHEWKPFDPLVSPNYTKYRYSSVELYADALSALITNPAYLMKKAPHFYEGFFNYLERKPEVKALYEQIQDEIKSGANQRSLVIRTREGFMKREEELNKLLKSRRNWLTMDALGTWFIDQNFAISRRVNKVGESNIPENFNPMYKLEEWRHSGTEAEGYLVDLNANVLEPLKGAGFTHIDFGEYLFHWRVSTERAELANPLGWTPERSKQRIKEMDKTFGPILNEAKDAYRKLREDWFISKAKEAKIYTPEQIKTIVENENYATFDIIGHLESRHGREATSHIFRQIGTFTETGNPFTATILKDLLMMRSINKQVAAKSVVSFFQEHFPKEIKSADTRWNGKFHEVMESGDSDFKLVGFLKNGEFKGYYLPKFVAESFRSNPNEANVIARLLRISFVPFRMMFTELNPGFWMFNLNRDYKAAAKQLPKLKMTKFLKYYLKAVPPAFRGAFGKPDEITKIALKNKSLLSVASYHWDAPEDLELERLLKRYGITKSYWNMKVLKPVTIFIDGMRNTARAMERIPKLGGYLYLKEKFPQMKAEKVAHLVRGRAGSPDFMRTGTGAPFYNYILPFSNAMKEGTRSAFEAGSENFGEYLWKTIKYNILWKTFVFGGLLGLGGWELKRILEGISDYDLANYNCYPIGLTENGKSVYIRIPQDETGRIIGGIYWMMAQKEYPKAFQSLFDYAAGQVPGLHPMITGAWAATEYMSGRNPFDSFRSRPIINEDVFLAGGKRSHKAFAQWMSNQFGGGIIHRFKHEGIKEIQTDLERFLNQPLASNIVGRFVKVSDYGIRQKANEELRKVASMAAEDRLLMNEALVKMLEAKGESLTDEEIMALVKNIDSLPYYTTKALSYKYGNVFLQKLITARSNEQKGVILRQMIAYMPYAQKIGPTQYLDSMVKEIKERISRDRASE